MIRKKRIFDDSKMLKSLIKQVCEIVPAVNHKTYTVKLGKEILKLSGFRVNELSNLFIDNAELKSDSPEISITKKWRLQIELMKIRAVNMIVYMDPNLPQEEVWELLRLGSFLGYGIVTEETIRLAEKYGLL